MDKTWNSTCRRLALLGLLLTFVATASAEEGWLGIYFGDTKIGYSSYSSRSEKVDGKAGTYAESATFIDTSMLGAGLTIRVTAKSWSDAAGRPIRGEYRQESAGRVLLVKAHYRANDIEVELDNTGAKSKKVVPIPKGAKLLDDPLSAFVTGKAPIAGAKAEVHVLDYSTATLLKNTVTVLGPRKVKVASREVDATAIELRDPRAPTTIFVGSKGDLVKIEGPMGMVMLPEPKAVATKLGGAAAPFDLAEATSIKLDRQVSRPFETRTVSFEVVGIDLSKAPSDGVQRVARDEERWIVAVTSSAPDAKKAKPLRQAAAEKPDLVAPALYIPSDSPAMRKLAREVVGDTDSAADAAEAVRAYVLGIMRPNAGIGVLRDATDVLKTKEGVCRDYAILAVTLLRAAGVPSRVVTGMLSDGSALFYHAWVEVWTGGEWLGMDPTRPEKRISALRIKLSQGNVEDAFVFTVLQNAKVRVLQVGY